MWNIIVWMKVFVMDGYSVWCTEWLTDACLLFMKQRVYRLTLPDVLCVVVIWQCALSWDVFIFHSQANKSLLWSKHLKAQLVYSLPPLNSTYIGVLWFEGVRVSYVVVFDHVEVAVFSVVWFDYWCKRLSQTGSGESNGVFGSQCGQGNPV